MKEKHNFELFAFEYLQLVGEQEKKEFWEKVEKLLKNLSEDEKKSYQDAMFAHLQKIQNDLLQFRQKSLDPQLRDAHS